MSETKNPKKKTTEEQPPKTLRQMLLDHPRDKYKLVPAALRWGIEVKDREQQPLTPKAIIDIALEEILTGKVTIDDVEKLPPPARPPSRSERPPKPPTSLEDDDKAVDDKADKKEKAEKE